MSNKINKSDSPKTGMVEASEEEQHYYESYPDTAPLTMKEVFARSRQATDKKKPKELTPASKN